MKKRVIIHSVAIWMGASLFLYSYPVLATTKIYDPMNPSETITPIPNEEPQATQTTDGEIIYESTDSSEITEASEASTVGSATRETGEAHSSEGLDQGDKKLENDPQKEKKQLEEVSKSNKQRKFTRQSPTPLMLDDDFFNSTSVTMPHPSSSGDAGGDDGFSQVALSAYLLSGVALYGESAAQSEIKLSDYFA